MSLRCCLALILAGLAYNPVVADDRRWENPVFENTDLAAAAADAEVSGLAADSPASLRFFVEAALGWPGSTSTTVGRFLITHAKSMNHDQVQRRTVERFEGEIPRQSGTIRRRLVRFGFPELPGLVYLRLVDSVDAFSNLNSASSDRMSRVGGVTYFCRYVVLPLSYVGADNLRDLKQSVALNPAMDADATLRQWQRQSYASLVSTFRHELVHVHTNSAIDLPRYSNRALYPTWFHEGTATYLAGDPHSGLSSRYQSYQKTFFYLTQRYGIAKLRDFYVEVLGGRDVMSALDSVYEITASEDLFQRSSRWHKVKSRVHVGLWIGGLVVVALALRGKNVPVIGALMLLVSVAMIFSLATGLSQHLVGLNGVGAVRAGQAVLGITALAIGLNGILRIRKHRVDAMG